MDVIQFSLKGYFDSIQKIWPEMLDTFRGLLQDYWKAFTSLFSLLIEKIMGVIGMSLQGYFTTFQKVFANVLDTFRGMLKVKKKL